MVNAQMYNYIPKKDILKVIKDKFKEPMVIVGDRFHDVEAGKDNNIFSIACGYGFGKKEEMSQANLIIDDIKDLKNIF
jgi:phosphoglycolate phosphatase